ncbi:MAG: TlyA family RNA methyltransferase [Vampirovibrionales bacterium]|nr:TlyA family RNA methyltransferase [Vampirovibrionales bacterium]
MTPPFEQPPKKTTAAKCRADDALHQAGLCPSPAQAQALIMAGQVFLGDHRIDKAGQPIHPSDYPRLRLATPSNATPFVSRGGLKLQAALAQFNICVKNRICLDVGASTGGFTDCLLQHDAAQVLSVDVGYNQLAWSLRQHPRVVSLERCHINRVAPESILADAQAPISFACIDVSFISLLRVLPSVVALLAPEAHLIALLKPQFEYKEAMDASAQKTFRGVVKQPEERLQIARHIICQIHQSIPPWHCAAAMPSPISGANGNREALLYLTKAKTSQKEPPDTESLALACFEPFA